MKRQIDFNQFQSLTVIPLSHDWQLKCPIYQKRLRMFMLQHPMSRQDRKDWMINTFRDNPEVLYMMEAPYFDAIIRDDSGKTIENFLYGTDSKKPEFMRWADAIMKLLHPELVLFAQEHEVKFLLPDDKNIIFH
ncbi:MAG: hypothetical protein KAS59_05840 [Alphaproteobacteria bacterium]|nr:hypothetical protein [Alphaproteobacteria bacterium]